MLRKLLLCVAVIAVSGSTVAMGAPTLSVIPMLSGDTTNSANAITADGAFVVGTSNLTVGTVTTTRGFLYPVGAASSTYVVSSDGAAATVANGVGYRTSGGNTELIISGMSSGYVTEWMTTTGGASFGGKRRNTAYTNNTVQTRNQLGATLGSDAYYVSSRNTGGTVLDINRGTGAWPATITTSPKNVTASGRIDGVGANGSVVGSRVPTSPSIRQNYRMDFNAAGAPANYYFNGLSTTNVLQGEGLDISDDGLAVAGWSPVGTSTTNSNAYKAQFSFNGTSYSWVRTDMLPETGLETGSTTRTVAYAISPNGRYLAGGSYQGVWHAMIWDTADANPANWTYTDLSNLAQSRGILGGFSRLERVWSLGVNATGQPVVTGTGPWSPDGGVTPYVSRAFVMTVPEPATMAMLALGGLALVRRRR